MDKTIARLVKNHKRRIRNKYLDLLDADLMDAYIDSVMAEYDSELVGAVTDRRSRTNPIIYRDEFRTALENFDYVKFDENTVKINLPEVDNFPWGTGRLRVIQNILEGIIGTYVEVDEEQYVAMFNKRPAIEPYDKTTQQKQRIYLLRWNSNVQRLWSDKFPKETPVWYPFSNMPSIDIFYRPNVEFEDNLGELMPDLVRKATKEAFINV